MAEMFHFFPTREDGLVRSLDRYLALVHDELFRARARITMLDGHIKLMGNMGFFNRNIIYGENTMLAPAESLPHPAGLYERGVQRPRMQVGFCRNRRTVTPTHVRNTEEHSNPELKHALSAHEIHSMKSLVDKALRVEETEKELHEDHKCKWVAKKVASSSSTRPRVVQPSGTRFAPLPPPRLQYNAPRP
ncbi:hypothetical protein E2562_031816 [Oryza meyeriana var. granulata]|uniref:Uncharacterized protein n=1 Tax=Oryza meyeriana var. granulata TaxID=110450 RepID=A0A6G1ED01_9ORYZ|nr:hypothetical protein E2562_031816 [Oryza meyeriana var. granulata]